LVEVKVDHSKCNGDSICVDVCPVAVFELQELSEYPGKRSLLWLTTMHALNAELARFNVPLRP